VCGIVSYLSKNVKEDVDSNQISSFSSGAGEPGDEEVKGQYLFSPCPLPPAPSAPTLITSLYF
jgi:hypothetical protein